MRIINIVGSFRRKGTVRTRILFAIGCLYFTFLFVFIFLVPMFVTGVVYSYYPSTKLTINLHFNLNGFVVPMCFCHIE